MVVDYNNGKIYTIRSHQTEDIYIGSTCSPLHKRFYTHKANFKSWEKTGNKYMTSFEIMKYDDAYIELLEDYPCPSKTHLNRREGRFIRNMDCVNKYVSGRTRGEYYQDNKEDIAQQKKQYYQDNKEHILLKQKKKYMNNKEEIAQRYKDNKEQILQKKNLN
tara:strand:- start:2623 stop:3108 length:486 start_codon:yes stop_codon:yes gene_type:complete